MAERPCAPGLSAPDPSHMLAQLGVRTRVLVMSSTFPRWPGDTEPPFVYNLSRRLADRFKVTVLTPHASGARLVEEMEGLDVHRFCYFWPKAAQRLAYGGMLENLKRSRWVWAQVPLFLAFELAYAIRIVRSHRIDVIHAHWVIPQGLVAAVAGWLTGKPVVVTVHGGDVFRLRGLAANALKRWVFRRVSRTTAVSQDLAAAIRQLSPDYALAIDVVPMGVDTQHFYRRRGAAGLRRKLRIDGPLILFVGRLAEKKGLRYLLEAMPHIRQRFPDLTLAIIGDGPLRGELSLQARDLGLGESVRFLGARKTQDLPDFYSAADVLVGPSIVAADGDVEGVPVTFMEALACGCPVVASDVGGVSEVIQHDKTGLLVPQRDSEALVAAVCRVLEDGDLRQRLRRNGRTYVVKNLTQASIARRYGAVLSEAAA